MLFLFPDGLISPLAGRKGLTSRVKKFASSRAGRKKRGSGKINFGEIIRCLRKFDLLPAIFFLKSRMDCNRALLSCPPVEKTRELSEGLKQEVRAFVHEYPHLEGHRQLGPLFKAMVGSHHAGQLPYWKALIEKLMNKGYLEAIFSTSTVAAGVNFPARTVALVQSDRYDGHEFINLTATDLHQMIGRAGRRGKDNIGFALVVPGLHQDPQLIYELRDSRPEPLMSQIHINFSMTLNLLLSHTPLEVKDLLKRSFAAFQERRSGSSVQRQWDEMLGRPL
jgi:superfamily II RNA helicase